MDIAVNIGGGTYTLQSTLSFNAADSGKDGHVVHYRAESGQHPVLSGGGTVANWSPIANPGLTLAPGVKLWQASVAAGTNANQLYFDGVRATLAESNADPTYPAGFRPTYFDKKGVSGIEYVLQGAPGSNWTNPNSANWSDPTKWTNVSDIKAVVYDQWKMASVPLKDVLAPSASIPSVDPVNAPLVGLIHLQDPAWTNANVYRGPAAGSTAAGSQKIDLAGTLAVADIQVGMNISGIGIPASAKVTQVDASTNTILISQAATATSLAGIPVQLTITDSSALQPVMGQPGIWSFWRVNKFVDAYQFLDQANEWYLDRSKGTVYLALPDGTNPNQHQIELPTLQTLIQGKSASNISFENLAFKNATWLGPDSANGYVSDQAGFHLTGVGHEPNLIGHVQTVTRMPGNVSFQDATGITFTGNTFEHLGAVALDFSGGAQNNRIANNIFRDVSGSAVQIGGVSPSDARPLSDAGVVRNNQVVGNFIKNIGAEFYDTAGINVGFAQNTRIENNFISDVPWSGISLGWGWGLMDQWISPTQPGVNLGSFPGLNGANPGMWGFNTTPTIMSGNQIVGNTITRFLQKSWDGGAIYTTGSQDGNGADLGLNGTLIANNYAYSKAPDGAGNIFYTDGGSRYLELKNNISFGNAVGPFDFGPVFSATDPLNKANPFNIFPLFNSILLYGSDIGGCVTYGDILYDGNRWENWWLANVFAPFNPTNWPSNPLYYNPGKHGTQDNPIGDAAIPGGPYPTNLLLLGNIEVSGLGAAVPLLLSPDQVLTFTQPTALGLTRADALSGVVTFSLLSLDDAHVETLLANATGRSVNALSYNSAVDGSWLASEGQAQGSAAAGPSKIGAGLWLPTATLDGVIPLALETLKADGNSALATFTGGYQVAFTLGGSRSIPNGTIVDDAAVTVKRVAAFDNGLAFYEADQRTGAISVSGKPLAPGDAEYLQGALANARAENLVIDASRMPSFGKQAAFDLPINDTKSYGLLLLVNNNPNIVFSSFSAANPGGAIQIVSLAALGGGVTFGVEDTLVTSGLSDRDYNDLIVTLGHAPLDPIS